MATPPFVPAIPDEVSTESLPTRMRHWAILRILVMAVALVLTIAVSSRLLTLLVPPEPSPLHALLAMSRNLFEAALLLGVYTLMVRWMERRSAVELALRAGAVQLPAGAVVGAGLMAASYCVLWISGIATVGPGTGLDALGAGLVSAFLAAVLEELVFRAVLFRIVEQACGTTVALVVSAVMFGLLHHLNPGSTLFTDAAIALEAGLLLGLAYALTRNLWLVIGLHAGWNFTEGSVFGAQVSGNAATPSVFHSTLTGPELLTGGGFGPEASVVAIGVCALASVVFAIGIFRSGGWRPLAYRPALE